MIDISDGLSSDLHHLCRESRVGAIIESGNFPSTLEWRRFADVGRWIRLCWPCMVVKILNCSSRFLPENVPRLPSKVDGVGLTRIGEVKPESEGIRVSEGSRLWDLKPEGWRHF